MEFEFPWPISQGEWLAWSSAAVTILFGLIMLFLPRHRAADPAAADRARASGGGRRKRAPPWPASISASVSAASCWPSPCSIMALGFSWLFTAFGRMVSMLSDRGNTPYNWISMVIELVLAALPLGLLASAS